MAAMEYRFSESAYVGTASDGRIVRVDQDEFAESLADAMRLGHGIILSELGDWDDVDPSIKAIYEQEEARLLDADEWASLAGDNSGVQLTDD